MSEIKRHRRVTTAKPGLARLSGSFGFADAPPAGPGCRSSGHLLGVGAPRKCSGSGPRASEDDRTNKPEDDNQQRPEDDGALGLDRGTADPRRTVVISDR